MTSRRRAVGAALVLTGAVLLSFGGARYALGAVAQDEARRLWAERDANAAMNAARTSALRNGTLDLAVAGEPVARLMIPRIRLDEIVLEGVNDDVLNGGPGHYPGSPLPGRSGNAIISAHRDRHFRHLDELALGDTLQTETASGIVTWVVISRRVIDKNAPALFLSATPRLTLTTCWPIQYLGSAPDRLIVTAQPIGSKKT